MLFSTTFRWTFVTWQFFSVMASASVFLTLLSIILGVVCRYNFGKGLLRYCGYIYLSQCTIFNLLHSGCAAIFPGERYSLSLPFRYRESGFSLA